MMRCSCVFVLIIPLLLILTTSAFSASGVPDADPKCKDDGYLPDSKDCKKFYRCVEKGRRGQKTFDRHEFSCPIGTCFDMKLSSCDFPSTVSNPETEPNPIPELEDKAKVQLEVSLKTVGDKWIESQDSFKLEPDEDDKNIQTQEPAVAVNNNNYWVYFEDNFDNNPNETGWIVSKYPGVENHWKGQFGWSPGIGYKNAEFEKGLLTLGSNSFYSISTKEFFPFSTKTNLVFILQYSAKETYNQNCAGSNIKLFDCSLDPLTLLGSTKHLMSFGPGRCGKDKPVIELKLHHDDGKEYNLYKGPRPEYNPNSVTQVYTLIIYPDEMRSYEIKVDGYIVKSGNVKEMVPTFNGWDAICGIGFEMYQSSAGTVFDNILMTYDQQLASERVKEILRITST